MQNYLIGKAESNSNKVIVHSIYVKLVHRTLFCKLMICRSFFACADF